MNGFLEFWGQVGGSLNWKSEGMGGGGYLHMYHWNSEGFPASRDLCSRESEGMEGF